MENYAELEINVGSKDDDSSYPLEGHADLAGDARGRLRLPSEDPEYQDLAAKFMTFQTSETILIRLGEKLFAALFQGQMRDLYLGVQGAVRSNPDLGLRIKLVFSAQTAEVAALPWEFLSEPGQGPLALLDCSIVRYPELPTPVLPLAGSLPLRVLLTSAVTPPPTTITEELDAVEKALTRLGRQVEVTKEPHLTGTGLRQLLSRRREEQFHVWHFVGHGGVGADGSTGMLVLEDPASQSGERGRLADPALFSALQLRIILNRSGVRLIVLDACETGKLGTDAFRSLAPQLIQAQIPAVVAMQFSVPDDVTVAFATAFYQSLAQSLPIDACVNEGRKEVMAAVGLDRPDWGIPVVYTRAADGRLFELSGPETGTPAPDLRSKQPAPPSEPVLPPPDHSRAVQHSSMVDNQGGVNIEVSGQITESPISISGIGVENVGAAGGVPKSDLTIISAVGGAPLDIRRDDAVRSESQFNDEVNSLSANITLLQRTLRLLEQRAAISGSMADPSLLMEIESKEKQMLLLLQQRIELRLGRREFLKDRQKGATAGQEQQLEEQIRAVSYEYLSDAMVLKRAEVKQLQARANNALDVERDQILRHIDEIRREIGLLDAQRRRQEPA